MDENFIANVIDAIRVKSHQLTLLRRQVAELEGELAQIRAALGDALPERPRLRSRHGSIGGRRSRPIQKGSSVWWARRVLAETASPVSVDDLIERIAALGGGSVKKTTLVSNLSRHIKHGHMFTRPTPNMYALADQEPREEGGGF